MDVSCLLIDAAGDASPAPPELTPSFTFEPRLAAMPEPGEAFVPTRAGRLQVRCGFEALGLVDTTPVTIEVRPSAPARSTATLDGERVVAGGKAQPVCRVFDAYDNLLADTSPVVRVEPSAAENTHADDVVTFRRAGSYAVHCDHAGAESIPAMLEVLPDRPAQLLVSAVPDKVAYAPGETIELSERVLDRFGNPVPDAEVTFHPDPACDKLKDRQVSCAEDGRYEVDAALTSASGGDALATSLSLVVDSTGPELPCDPDFDDRSINLGAGSHPTFASSVRDLSAVETVTVNGEKVSPDQDGEYQIDLTTVHGINFVELAGVDATGRETRNLCTFLAADEWLANGAELDGALSLSLRQAALDDGERSRPDSSLVDVLQKALNSAQLEQRLDGALNDANPLKPSSCDSKVLGACVLRSEVSYRDLELKGPSRLKLDLVDGGATWAVRVEDLRLRIRVRGKVAGISYDTTGWVTFAAVDLSLTSDLQLDGGRPVTRVRADTTETQVSKIKTDFGGLDGGVLNVLSGLFNGAVRKMVASNVSRYVSDQLNTKLAALLGGVTVGELGATLKVPRVDSSASISLASGLGFSKVDANPNRLWVGLATRFHASPVHARPSPGAAVRRGGATLDLSGRSPAAASVHEGVLGQLAHSLWLAGFFDATLSGSLFSELVPPEATFSVTTRLPPVAEVMDGRVRLSLGGITIVATGVSEQPVHVALGLRASLALGLAGGSLALDDFTVDELHVQAQEGAPSEQIQSMLQAVMVPLAEELVTNALESALPALAIPSLEIPASIAAFGLPEDAALSIAAPSLQLAPPHVVVEGALALE